ncbi:MAG: phosphoribosylformylglycinamidine cyclo-ligase [Bacteroidota bacterium]
MSLTYQKAGVNIPEGDKFIGLIKRTVRSTYKTGVLGDIGAFGAFFDARFRGMRSPVLVSSVDGVGTKLIVAQMMGRHDTVGQDLVNHCVNDILSCGAAPLFFLDYFATGSLNADAAAKVISGFAKACRENGCSLIGGETAEMPGLYEPHEYDLAGTVVGVVERGRIVDGRRIRKGDVLIGLPSTGLHTNGYSLARAALLGPYALDQFIAELGTTLGEALLAVHRSYLRTVQPLLRRFDVRGLSHITGGGIVGNTSRVLPKRRTLRVDWGAWQKPPIFDLIQKTGDVPEEDMRRTFNLGIGMIVIVPAAQAEGVVSFLAKRREPAVILGEVV